MIDKPTIDYYRKHAETVCATYRSAESGISVRFVQAFPHGGRILDVGAGSGRDLAHLLQSGFVAEGVEPVENMIREAITAYPILREKIHTGALPKLDKFESNSFDGILCSAVLMHIPEAHLFDAVWELKRLLKDKGRLMVSLPVDSSLKEEVIGDVLCVESDTESFSPSSCNRHNSSQQSHAILVDRLCNTI